MHPVDHHIAGEEDALLGDVHQTGGRRRAADVDQLDGLTAPVDGHPVGEGDLRGDDAQGRQLRSHLGLIPEGRDDLLTKGLVVVLHPLPGQFMGHHRRGEELIAQNAFSPIIGVNHIGDLLVRHLGDDLSPPTGLGRDHGRVH